MKKFLLALCLFLFCFNVLAKLEVEFLVDGSKNPVMFAGEKSRWVFRYKNPMGMNHSMFMKMHEKLMHLVIISEDRSQFAHIHPYFDMERKEFYIDVNDIAWDSDNVAQEGAVPFGGKYFVYTDVMPMVMGQEPVMQIDSFELKVIGDQPLPSFFDFPNADSPIEKEFFEGNELFRVRFWYQNFDFCSYYMPKFYAQIDRWVDGAYQAAEGFDKWLGMGGHIIVFSAEDQGSDFIHMHSLLPIAKKGKFSFPYHNIKPLNAGEYNSWVQFNFQGQILTFPFEFSYTYPLGSEVNSFCFSL
ncbi:MAG: hypothetical protein H6620_07550 [Halobacteriovoraceae bacterium]|nr:hypothetical protein [Halobacteriovoraceae bacterium]